MGKITALAYHSIDQVYEAEKNFIMLLNARIASGVHFSDPTQDRSQKVVEIFLRLQKESLKESHDQIKANIGWQRGASIIEQLTFAPESYIVGGFEAILSSLITGTWAAFESLAEDLWIAAVNASPNKAARLFIDNNRDKTIDLQYLAKYNFDLSNHMGQILVDRKRAEFNSLADIKKAYKSAFGASLVDALSKDRNLYLTEKLRHLYAHRSGLVDEKFSAEVSDYNFDLPVIVGQQFFIDGKIVKLCLDACVKAAIDLVEEIDRLNNDV